MALMVQIHEARQLDEGIWKARLSPSEIRFLDPKAENVGPFSVLLLTEKPLLTVRATLSRLIRRASNCSMLVRRTLPFSLGPRSAPLAPLSLPRHPKPRLGRETRSFFSRFLRT